MLAFLFVLKIIFIIIITGFIVAVIWLWIKSLPFRPKLNPLETLNLLKVIKITDGRYRHIIKHREVIYKKWNKLMERARLGDERDLRLVIIEADSLIDEILKEHGHSGKDMGERLKSIHPSEISNLNNLWEAHKIRNRLVHEVGFILSLDESKRLIEIYHKTIEELLNVELELI
jgi:hypothetical protein